MCEPDDGYPRIPASWRHAIRWPADRPGDLSWASFTDEAPWEVERNDVRWLNLAVTLRRQAQAEVPALTRAVAPAARSASRVGRRAADRRRRPVDRPQATRALRRRPGRQSERHLEAAADRRRGARTHLHQARPDHLLRRGPVPDRTRRGVQEVPRPGSARTVRGRPADGRAGPRRPSGGRLRIVRRDGARLGLDRPGARGHG